MTSKRLWQLALVAIVAVAIAFYVERERRPQTATGAQSELLFPGFEARLNDIDRVTVTEAGDKVAITLVKGDEHWGVEQKGAYAADIGKLRSLLLDLADAKLIERKTAKPENHARLGVADLSDTEANGVLIEAASGDEAYAVIVGNAGALSGSTYVRRPGEAQSWLANKDLSVDTEPVDWVDDRILDIPASRIQSVTIAHPDDTRLTVVKAARSDVNYSVADVPAGKVLTSPSAANALANVLSALTFDDVVPASEFDTQGKSPTQITYAAFDGLVVDAQAFDLGEGEYFAAFTARVDRDQAERFFTPPAAPPDSDEPAEGSDDDMAGSEEDPLTDEAMVDAEAEAEAAPQAKPDLAAVEEEAAEISGRLSGWVFRIPAYKHAQMKRTVADLVKDEE